LPTRIRPIATREALQSYDAELYALVDETMAYGGHVDWGFERGAYAVETGAATGELGSPNSPVVNARCSSVWEQVVGSPKGLRLLSARPLESVCQTNEFSLAI
jgi:hypothetical protein